MIDSHQVVFKSVCGGDFYFCSRRNKAYVSVWKFLNK